MELPQGQNRRNSDPALGQSFIPREGGLSKLENNLNMLQGRLDLLEVDAAWPPLELLEDRSVQWKDKITPWDHGKGLTSSALSALRPCYCCLPPRLISITIINNSLAFRRSDSSVKKCYRGRNMQTDRHKRKGILSKSF